MIIFKYKSLLLINKFKYLNLINKGTTYILMENVCDESMKQI